MREYLVTVLLAALITYLVTPLVKDLAVKAGNGDYEKMNKDSIAEWSK